MIPILSSSSRLRLPIPLQPECIPLDGSKPIDSESLYMASTSFTSSSLGTPNIIAKFAFSYKSAQLLELLLVHRIAEQMRLVPDGIILPFIQASSQVFCLLLTGHTGI